MTLGYSPLCLPSYAWGAFCLLIGCLEVLQGESIDLEGRFDRQVRPFIKRYCLDCHSGDRPKAKFDISSFDSLDAVRRDFGHWDLILERLETGEMPPEDAEFLPRAEVSESVIKWMHQFRRSEAARQAGDPGPVPIRRLSHAEYTHVIEDLTGVAISPAATFPLDPANEQGFDNTAESLTVSPALFQKYLESAQEVARHLVMTPRGLHFAPYPVETETDLDRYGVYRIVDFYRSQNTRLEDYFEAAWRLKTESGLGSSTQAWKHSAAESGLSGKYLQTLYTLLESQDHDHGPIRRLRELWRMHASPDKPHDKVLPEERFKVMVDYIQSVRALISFQIPHLRSKGIHNGSQAFVLWRNRQKASRRMLVDLARIQETLSTSGHLLGFDPPDDQAPSLLAPEQIQSLEWFGRVFPDGFYVAERGREFLDPDPNRQEVEKGRLLSAGFHSMMGYFRDDEPLYELLLEEADQAKLDQLWKALHFTTRAPMRQHQGMVWFERTDSKFMRDEAFDFARAEDKDVTSEPKIRRLADVYLTKAISMGADALAVEAIKQHFEVINHQIRQVESWMEEARYHHLKALERLAAIAYRRPLEVMEAESMRRFYRRLVIEDGLSHEEAIRDSLISILVSPHFWHRLDLAAESNQGHALSGQALANRLSFFLWSSLPDEPLMVDALAGRLAEKSILIQHMRRMIQDIRFKRMVREFMGHWLGFRQFEDHNSVDRNRFANFTPALRSAMFEEPIRFFQELVLQDRPMLELLYAEHTWVNPVLANHYEIVLPEGLKPDQWIKVQAADRSRGGLLTMGVFLTMNAPGLRTSPVKRGYWLVHQLLGQPIPPPPPNVPELPADESRMDVSLPEMLARHRQVSQCAQCHEKFDAMGLCFEAYGPVGELRTQDMAGRPIADAVRFPDQTQGVGVDGLKRYLKIQREGDFVRQLTSKLLAYALGRNLMLSDEPFIEEMIQGLDAHDHSTQWLIEQIITSSQFQNRRGDSQVTWSPAL